MKSYVVHGKKLIFNTAVRRLPKQEVHRKLNREAAEKLPYAKNAAIVRDEANSKYFDCYLSMEEGILFAASLLKKYKQNNFVFATRFESRGSYFIACLMVQNRKIIWDAVVPQSDFAAEFGEELKSDDEGESGSDYLKKVLYHFYDHNGVFRNGNNTNDNPDAYTLTPLRVKSYQKLEQWPFTEANSENVIARPMRVALRNSGFFSKEEKTKKVLTGLFGLAFIGFAAMWFVNNANQDVKVVDEYKSFKEILEKSGVNVNVRMAQLYNLVTLISDIPGWSIGPIKVKGGKSSVTLDREQGNLRELQAWIDNTYPDFKLNVKKKDVKLELNQGTAPILSTAYRMKLDKLNPYLKDCFDFVLPDVDIQISPAASKNGYKNSKMVLTLKQHSKYDLERIGSIIKGFPVAFMDANLKLEPQTGMISGSIELAVVGV